MAKSHLKKEDQTSEIVQRINSSCKNFFLESKFYISEKSYNNYIISGDNLGTAINNYNGDKEEIKVLKWFKDFWLYIDIKFSPLQDEFPHIFFSLSVFQGKGDDNIKIQLFRAEWDNYDSHESLHPQPHWHIYSNYVLERQSSAFKEFIKINNKNNTFTEFLKEKKVDSEFVDLINEDNIDIKKIHFAMNGNWSNNLGYIHKINDVDSFTNWLTGLLEHIKSQLEYVKQ